MEPRYPFVAVDVAEADADELGDRLFELGAQGVEVRDDQTLVRGPGGGRVTVVASLTTREEADAIVAELSAEGMAARVEEIVGDAWRDAWKEHFAPFSLTQRITVTPPWIAYAAQRPDELVLELEPGRAFGTGLHATTALVAEILEERATSLAGVRLLDLGTGSGILSLVALRLGAAHALAIDLDEDVIEVVRENAERNGLADRLTARAGTIATVEGTFPWVVANIEARVLRTIAGDLAAAVMPGGTLVLSGVLAREHDEMVTLYGSLGFTVRSTRRRTDTGDDADAWVAIEIVR